MRSLSELTNNKFRYFLTKACKTLQKVLEFYERSDLLD
nr:MAG TPA: hypothetical protein [Caudoviricetes sp.]